MSTSSSMKHDGGGGGGGEPYRPTKRIKPDDDGGNDVKYGRRHDRGDETTAAYARDDVRRAWEHYRNFIDGQDGDDDDGDGNCDGEEEGEEGQDRMRTAVVGDDVDCDRPSGKEEADEEAGGGDVDELLELIEILSPAKAESSPLASMPEISAAEGVADCDGENNPAPPLGEVATLVPMLLSMSHLHLASNAISETMFDPDNMQASETEKTSSSSSPEYHFQKSLHHWPTNPAARSLLANYRRMNSLSSVEEICGHYVKAADHANFWRNRALIFLQSSTVEDEEEDEEEDGGINAKEWVELLVLNGALDVDYVGGDDDEEEGDEEGEASINGGGEKKQRHEEAKDEAEGEVEEEYSCSQVEATASFMSAFLLSTLSRHDEALRHLRKFRLSHRIHPNVWKEARSGGRDAPTKNGCGGDFGDSSTFFPPRVYRGTADNDSGVKGGGVLPPHLYKRLRALLAPNAPYWKESEYDRRGYYSYFIDLDATTDASPSVKERPTNVIEEAIVDHLLPLAERTLRESAADSKRPIPRIVGAEWWAHTRPLGANLGHQVHFDTDESLLGRKRSVTHPVVSSVLYLTGNDSTSDVSGKDSEKDGAEDTAPGATVVFDQTPDSEDVAPRAWVSRPRDNSFMAFPGNLLHGVLPCAGSGKEMAAPGDGAGSSGGTRGSDGGDGGKKKSPDRLTFMVGFWTRNVTVGMGERELYSPCGPLPPASAEHSWVIENRRGYDEEAPDPEGEQDGNHVSRKREPQNDATFEILPTASPAWEKFDDGDEGPRRSPNAAEPGGPLPIPRGLDHRFFVWDAPRCFTESLFDKEDRF